MCITLIGRCSMSIESAEQRKKALPKLGYWKIRGLAQPIRLLLKYTGTEFEDDFYVQGGAPDYSMEKWLSVKFALGLDFPNLPYLIDGDLKLTQCRAILHYIAGQHNLCGKTEQEKATVEMLEETMFDLWFHFARTCYDPNFANIHDDLVKNVTGKLKPFSDYLGSKKWFMGDEITSADFVIYEVLDELHEFEPSIFANYPTLKAFCDRFEALPAIKQYMESEEFFRRPIFRLNAQWT